MALEQLLGTFPRATFMERHFLKLPFVRAGGCHDLVRSVTWDALAALLAQPGADLLVGRGGEQRPTSAPLSPTAARSLLAAGYTVGVRNGDQYNAVLADLVGGFREDFLAPVDVHLYCTPAGQPGFGWHYDAEDVFVLQAGGTKEWWLRVNTVHPWPLAGALPEDMRYEREVTPVLRCTLAAGDWLYVPAGHWHRTEAGPESLSLSVGVRSVTALDAYDFLRRGLRSSLLWRQRLPPAGRASPRGKEELVGQLLAVFTELGRDLARVYGDEATAREFLQHLRSPAEPPPASRGAGGPQPGTVHEADENGHDRRA